jgi:hypothetical protein
MRVIALGLALAAPLALAPGKAVSAKPSLCRPGEPVLFECSAGAKMIAVCGKTPEYRFGTPARLDLTASAGMTYATTAYSGGGEQELIVANGAYRYIVYSSMIRTNFGPGGNNPAFEAGVSVQKDGKTVSTRKCTAPKDAGIDLDLAAKSLPEGEFIYR